MRDSPVLCAVRAAVFAVVCVLLGAFGHALGTHAALPAATTAQAWAVVAVIACALATREHGFVAIAGFMLAAQGLLHLWFQAVQIDAAQLDGAQTGGHASRCVSVIQLPSGLNVPELCGTAMPTWAVNALMLGAQLAAALVCAWWLRRGESALFALGHVVLACGRALIVSAALLLGFVPLARPVRPTRRRRVWPRPRLLSAGACLPVVRRGPPTWRVVVAVSV